MAFQYGGPHPNGIDLRSRRESRLRRFAKHYCDVLAAANGLYLQGHDNLLRGLELFDLEEVNIRDGQAWAARHCASDRDAAQICRDYPLGAHNLIDLRLSEQEQIRWFEEALAVCLRIGDRAGEGGALAGLGNAWLGLGETKTAVEFFERALAVFREVGHRQGEGMVLGNLGSGWLTLGDAKKAIEFYEQSLAIEREIGNRRGEAHALASLGRAHADLLGSPGIKDPEWEEICEATDRIEEALSAARELGDLNLVSNFLMYQGTVYHCGKEHHQARLRNLRQKPGFESQRTSGMDFEIISVAAELKTFSELGATCFEQALAIFQKIGDRKREAFASWNLAVALDESERRDAVRHAQHALDILTEIQSLHAEKAGQILAEWQRGVSGEAQLLPVEG